MRTRRRPEHTRLDCAILGEAGIGLAETLVALAIFAVSMGAVGKFMVQHLRLVTSNNLSSIAYAIGAQQIEALRTVDYGSITSSTVTQTTNSVVFTTTTGVVADSPSPNVKSITVTVSWAEPLGAKNVALSTIYTDITR